MSADAQRLLQLRTQLSCFCTMEHQLVQFAEFQDAALLSTIDDVSTLEAQNAQLKRSFLAMLRTMATETDGQPLKATCAGIIDWMDLRLLSPGSVNEGGFQSASHRCSSVATNEDALQHFHGAERHPQPNEVWPRNATTVLIRNIPPRSNVEEILKAFPPDGSYDLLHLPFNIKARRTSSFATINFVCAELAADFHERFNGQQLPHSVRSHKDPLMIMPAKIQGLEANLTFLRDEKGIAEMRNPALLPRLYLVGAVAERLASMGPTCVKLPDEPGQPHRLDFREVLDMLSNAEV